MKLVVLFLVSTLFMAHAYAANKVFDNPRYDSGGVPHHIIYEDLLEDDWYDSSALGFCRLNGFEGVYQTSAVLGWDGPYVALDEKGGVIKIFPADIGDRQRFYEFTQIICN